MPLLTELPAISAIDDDDILVIEEDGVTKRITVAELRLALSPTWQDYTPAWTTSGTAPAIGNGSLAGRYRIVGKTVHFSIAAVFGSTSTYGTGGWTFSLPPGCVAKTTGVRQLLHLWALDTGTAHRHGVAYCDPGASTTSALVHHGASTGWSATNPHTWATGDSLGISGNLEID